MSSCNRPVTGDRDLGPHGQYIPQAPDPCFSPALHGSRATSSCMAHSRDLPTGAWLLEGTCSPQCNCALWTGIMLRFLARPGRDRGQCYPFREGTLRMVSEKEFSRGPQEAV